MIVKDVIAIASSILLSVGGASVMICACSGFLTERIAKRIDGKYQQKLDQELEKYRGVIEQKKYVSQSQFDYVIVLANLVQASCNIRTMVPVLSGQRF